MFEIGDSVHINAIGENLHDKKFNNGTIVGIHDQNKYPLQVMFLDDPVRYYFGEDM